MPLEIQFFQQNLLSESPVAYESQVVQGPVPCAAAMKAEAHMFAQAPSRTMLVTWSGLTGKGRVRAGEVSAGFPFAGKNQSHAFGES